MKNRILITGGAGFVGHHFVEHFLKNSDYDIVVFDRLNYAGTIDRLRDINAFDDKRVTTLTADFSHPIEENLAKEMGAVEYIFHIGAESHVDNSIEDPVKFVRSNVEGTAHVLNYARTIENLKGFFYFSTDEVFGPAPEGVEFGEKDYQYPSNPYAATKAGGEDLVKAFANTYKLPCVITRSMNIFGERQHPEKFIPLVVKKVLTGEEVTIHADSTKTKAGSRFYIHARNVADGYQFLLDNIEIKPGTCEEFHITGEKEVDNLELAQFIASVLDKELKYKMVDFHSSRPGHDLRYALSGAKMAKLGWEPPKSFEESLRKTIEWTVERKEDWLYV